MTNEELKLLADKFHKALNEPNETVLNYYFNDGELCDIRDILTTLAKVSDGEPERDERITDNSAFDIENRVSVSAEYAYHWRNKAMQLAVDLERVKRSALTLANTSHAISSDRLERARKLANESKPEVVDSERQANQILTEKNEQLKAKIRNVAGWLNNQCEPAQAAAELLLIAGLPPEQKT